MALLVALYYLFIRIYSSEFCAHLVQITLTFYHWLFSRAFNLLNYTNRKRIDRVQSLYVHNMDSALRNIAEEEVY
jgi:hypothetical protein